MFQKRGLFFGTLMKYGKKWNSRSFGYQLIQLPNHVAIYFQAFIYFNSIIIWSELACIAFDVFVAW